MDAIQQSKRLAAEAALQFIENDMLVGLGTGSTAKLFIDALGAAMKAGKLKGVRGIPTSIASDKQAKELGIPIVTFAQFPRTNVAIDGADEIAPGLQLVKGLGGALLREKVVAQSSDKFIVIADDSKEVPALATKCPLPVEVTIFGHETQPNFFRTLGGEATLRQKDGKTFVTDNGNYIFDVKFPTIPDPASLELKLKSRAGIVETGLFISMAKVAIIAGADGKIRERTT